MTHAIASTQQILQGRASPAHYSLSDLDADTLRRLVISNGYNPTLDLLYQSIRNRAPHDAFIEQVDAIAAVSPTLKSDIALAIVPGALYRQYPQNGRRRQTLH